MEHIIDTLLERLELSRANLIYSGGGHCYLLLANTQKTREVLNTLQKELQSWFLKYFRTRTFCGIWLQRMQRQYISETFRKEAMQICSSGLLRAYRK